MSSRAKQLADAEADRVERDEAEAAELDTDAPESVERESDELAAETGTADMEAVFGMLDREHERHRVALSTILGADFDQFIGCEVCAELGYRNLGGDIPYDPTLKACDLCGGHGMVQTHSRHPQHAVRECLACQGQGFVPDVKAPEPVAPPAAPVARFDPFTGQPLDVAQQGVAAGYDAGHAPGYVPPAVPLPSYAPPR